MLHSYISILVGPLCCMTTSIHTDFCSHDDALPAQSRYCIFLPLLCSSITRPVINHTEQNPVQPQPTKRQRVCFDHTDWVCLLLRIVSTTERKKQYYHGMLLQAFLFTPEAVADHHRNLDHVDSYWNQPVAAMMNHCRIQ